MPPPTEQTTFLETHANGRIIRLVPPCPPQPRPPTIEMVRQNDAETSLEAARSILCKLTILQLEIYAAFAKHGPMTARECENLPELAHCGFSTCRKRISEMSHKIPPVLVPAGRKEGMTLWRMAIK